MTKSLFPNPGELFESRYRVGPLIGSGGFARVYLATQEDLGRQVALKILTPTGSAEGTYDSKLVERFNQEARLVSRLRDPHTITMFDYGRTPEGLLYMVFEYIDGHSLATVVRNEGRIEGARVAKILTQTLSSLEEAHAMGVLHRDIKPGNIMVFEHVGRPDQVKLLDFGIAKLTDASATMKGDLTADGALIGTPRYMSPEQIRGEEVTAQSDIYSLGLVAYEMLVGRKAIESNSSVTIIGKQLDPKSFFVPRLATCPEGVRVIVNRMLAKSADGRFRSAREVLDAFDEWKTSGTVAGLGANATILQPRSDRSEEFLPVDARPSTNRIHLRGAELELERVAVRGVHDRGPAMEPAREPAPVPAFTEPNTSVSGVRRRSNTLPLVGIGALVVLILGFALVTVFRPDTAEVIESPAMAKPSKPVTQPPAEPAVSRRMMVRTSPTDLELTLNGRPLGRSPITVEEANIEFPATIRVTISEEHDKVLEVKGFQADVLVDVASEIAALAAVEKPAPAEKLSEPVEKTAEPVKARKTRPKVRKTTAKKAEKPAKKPAEPEEKKDLNLPALDF